MTGGIMNRSILKIAAIVLFVLVAVFVFAVHSISLTTDFGLTAIALAAWAAS